MNRLEEVKRIFEKALAKAVEAVRVAREELTRPLARDEILERDKDL